LPLLVIAKAALPAAQILITAVEVIDAVKTTVKEQVVRMPFPVLI
jgi:chaperone required for assembly of F1-ATPase